MIVNVIVTVIVVIVMDVMRPLVAMHRVHCLHRSVSGHRIR